MAETTIDIRHPRAADGQWLAKVQEDILDPGLPIIDAHHHLMKRGEISYFVDDYLRDVDTGHNIRGTVYIECGSMWRAEGPPMMAPLGEVEFANGVAAISASGQHGPARVCAGIVGTADLTAGDAIAALLDAQVSASPDRFRGIRLSAVWDIDPRLRTGRVQASQSMLADPIFRAGFAQLGPRGLSFEAWAFHPQLDEVVDLARAFPETTIIVNHMGGPLARAGDYTLRRDEELANWRKALTRLAACPNVYMKLGGLGMPFMGYGFAGADMPPTSVQLAEAWGPDMKACIDAFGPSKCMFESNFPPDKQSCSYPVMWNAFKRIAAGYSADERQAMFYGAAQQAYRLTQLAP
jgi:L-fuconolactonase